MSEVRQRWRLVFGRDTDAQFLSHLDAVRLWERAFRRGDIPVARSEGFNPRPKVVFAAPLPLGMLAEHELADLFLDERLTLPDLRARLGSGMPRGYRVGDIHDVWIGAPAIAPQLSAADYRMTLLNVERVQLEAACSRLMAAERLPRRRRQESRAVAYDLRPLLLALRTQDPDPLAVADDPGVAAAGLWMRLRHSQERGSGRAEEVVAALADQMGLAVRLSAGAADPNEEPGVAGQTTEAAEPPEKPARAGAALDRGPAPELGPLLGPAPEFGPTTAPGAVGGGLPVELIPPVRERLWLADELP